jgi:hypothetical protein
MGYHRQGAFPKSATFLERSVIQVQKQNKQLLNDELIFRDFLNSSYSSSSV